MEVKNCSFKIIPNYQDFADDNNWNRNPPAPFSR